MMTDANPPFDNDLIEKRNHNSATTLPVYVSYCLGSCGECTGFYSDDAGVAAASLAWFITMFLFYFPKRKTASNSFPSIYPSFLTNVYHQVAAQSIYNYNFLSNKQDPCVSFVNEHSILHNWELIIINSRRVTLVEYYVLLKVLMIGLSL